MRKINYLFNKKRIKVSRALHSVHYNAIFFSLFIWAILGGWTAKTVSAKPTYLALNQNVSPAFLGDEFKENTLSPSEQTQDLLNIDLAEDSKNESPKTVFDPSREAEIILQLTLGRFLLSDGFIGYLDGSLALPLGEILNALEFPITVNPAEGRAEGWFLRENRRFFLDVFRSEAVVEGKNIQYLQKNVFIRDGEIYVESRLFGSWFPISFEFDISTLRVNIITKEKLPFEERLERETRRTKLQGGRIEKKTFPRKEIPYRLFDWPWLDSSYLFSYDSDFDRFLADFSNLASGDFLYMNSELFIAGNEKDKLTSLRLNLNREDPDGRLLGPLKATEITLGDIITTQTPLVSSSVRGAGFSLSSFPIHRETEFDRVTLRGDLQVGWEVELYRNEVLLDAQVGPNGEGRYEFLDVPLLAGANLVRLVFYGPQGQKREVVKRFNVGQEQVPPGKQYFRVGANLSEKDMIEFENESNASPVIGAGKMRYFLEYERGINRSFSVSGSLASLPLRNRERRHYASLGVRTGVLGASSRFDFTKDSQGGLAFQSAILRQVFGFNLFGEHSSFNNFFSERELQFNDPVERRTKVRIDSISPEWGFLPRIPWSITGDLERLKSGIGRIDLSNRLSLYLFGISASNTLDWNLTRGGEVEARTQGTGTFQLSGHFERFSLRGILDYGIKPDAELESTSVTMDYGLYQDFSARLGITQRLEEDPLTIFNAGLNRRFKSFAVGLIGSYGSDGVFSIGASFTYSFGREPRRKTWIARSDRLATSGSASALVFLDNNNNMKFDKGDEPLKDVEFQPRNRGVKTDEDGIALISGFARGKSTSVSIDISSLEDPFWIPSREGYEIIPRPGRPVLLDFPITPTGEVEGTVFLLTGESEKAVSNTQIQLVNAKREVVQEVTSEFDGFYLFQLVPPGRYWVRISPEQVERLNLKTPEQQEVIIVGSETVIGGVDFLLKRIKHDEKNVK